MFPIFSSIFVAVKLSGAVGHSIGRAESETVQNVKYTGNLVT